MVLVEITCTSAADPCHSYGWLCHIIEPNGWFQRFHQAMNSIEWIVWSATVISYLLAALVIVYQIYWLDTRFWGPPQVFKLGIACN